MPFVSLECIVNVEHIWIVERLFLFATIYMAKLVRKFRLIYITIAFVLACCDTVWYNAMILSQLKSARCYVGQLLPTHANKENKRMNFL